MAARPQLAQSIGFGLVARVLKVGHPAYGVVLGERNGVVGEGSVGSRRRGDKQLSRPSGRGRLEDVLRAAYVDLIHRLLVVHGVDDEGEVHERVGSLALEQAKDARAVAHVDLLIGDLWSKLAGRTHVGDRHLVRVLALEQVLEEAGPDIARAACDQVPHGLSPTPTQSP